MKSLKEKFRKIDFLVPIVVGGLLVWWSFEIKAYAGFVIIPIFTIVASRSIWEWTRGTEKYRMKIKELALKRKMEIDEINKAKGKYSISGPFVFQQVFGCIGLIVLLLYLLILSIAHHKYLSSLIILGAEFFFITMLLFSLTQHKKIWRPTIIGLTLVATYFAILYAYYLLN